jgi:hypothetical protein
MTKMHHLANYMGNRVLLDKLIVVQLVKICTKFYRPRNCITVFTDPRNVP